jgi:hypothetical protein
MKQQPKFEDGQTVKFRGELVSIWRVFYNDCGQPMYEVDGLAQTSEPEDGLEVYEWQLSEPSHEDLYGINATPMNSFQQFSQIVNRINAGVEREAERQQIEQENARFVYAHWGWTYNPPYHGGTQGKQL